MEAAVLRIGHRISRDHRISTHCGLVSRAFGAKSIIYSGEHDGKLLKSVSEASIQWGGSFSAVYEKSWRKAIKEYRDKGYCVVHLTMYGMPVQKQMTKIRKSAKVLVVVGGEKVPWEVYDLADYNVSVTSQPHSEIAALSVFLDRLFRGKELDMPFDGGRIKVIPQKRGKRLERNRF